MITFIIFQTLKQKEELVNKILISGFGYGKKTDLDVGKHPHNINPSPDTYNLNTFVDTNKLHKSGFNISIGR